MSAPNDTPPGRASARRWRTGTAVGVAVLVVGLVVLALVPRTATATASLTVTPRTDAGAAAALLVADRYTALAASPGTLRTARDADPALEDVALDDLAAGTTAARAAGGATITVRVRLADRADAAAAADAVVATLVQAGAGEDLVDVDAGAEASAARADVSPDPRRWSVVVLLLALAAGITAAALAGRPSRSRPTGRADLPAPPPVGGTGSDRAPAEPAEVLDDLPGFLENPPGSAPALSVAAPVSALTEPVDEPTDPPRTGATAAAPSGPPPATPSRRGTAVATALTVLALVVAAVLVGVAGQDPDTPARAADTTAPAPIPTGGAATLSAPTGAAAPGADATAPASAPATATATDAAALALQSVPLGDDGLAAAATFAGVVLEQRAVGLTVTYPSLSVTTDGSRSLAHLRLPTFNCLTPEPPEDPLAAGCVRSLTEYADLPSPQLQVSRDGDTVEVVGLFATYTRPNGSAPGHTGRAYQLTAAITADGPQREGSAPAAGVVRIGLDSAATSAERGINLLQLPG